MKKSCFAGLLVIILTFILVSIINVISFNINPSYVYAYDPSYTSTLYSTSPNLINAMDTTHTVVMQYSPAGSENDVFGWSGGSAFAVTPTPGVREYIYNGTTPEEDYPPTNAFNGSFMHVTWTGNSAGSAQYIHLTNYANISNISGTNFENCGCGGTYSTPLAVFNAAKAGDMGCYSYLGFYLYLNTMANGGNTVADVSQRAGLYDGNITLTAGSVIFDSQSKNKSEPFTNHFTMSLNAMANHYDTATGRYFSVSNIADIIINAPDTDYKNLAILAPSAFAAGSRSLIMYYDYVSLGARAAVPYYDSPSDITIKTAADGKGAWISWSPQSNYISAVPVTAYHVYRKLTSGNAADDTTVNHFEPYVSVGIVSASNPLCITDTAVSGGDIYCYKVLTCNNGPASSGLPEDERAMTINANYNEPLLNDTSANVARVCGYVNPAPTSTLTPTISPTTCLINCATATPTYTPSPTCTATAVVPPPDLANAHVYPNPYNPNAALSGLGGSGKFHVDNTPNGTKIYIYSMDGALVKEGVFKSSSAAFTWDGKNKNGSKVVSGLYYLVLEAPDKKTRVFRIIVCYKCDPVYHQ